ncbi:MAG: serine/threonine protein kinase, partial [Nannocystaceae bacterium]|nr:serine/threonine protein kinase [Nannocystaceae bacterium]
MTPERWRRVQELFEAALALPSAERDAFIATECGEDDALGSEVASLLVADARTDALVDKPVAPQVPSPDSSDDTEKLPAGTQLGEYVLENEIGTGGFGRVYRAVHPVIRKTAAIKVLHRRYSASQTHATRFLNEARTVNEIGHPDIIDVFAFGETDDARLYFVMELIEAPTLAQRLHDDGPLSLSRALPILRRLAAAIDAAHEHGVIHRDLKPANVLLVETEDGEVRPKLHDFGIAKLRELPSPTEVQDDAATAGGEAATAEGQILGTPAYMSPEQSRGRPVEASTDIYAFGILAYEMLTGVVPFRGTTPLETLMRHVNEVATPPSALVATLPVGIDEAIAAMLAKNSGDRPS